MKAYLGLPDSDRIYESEAAGAEARLFGIDRRERGFARVHLA